MRINRRLTAAAVALAMGAGIVVTPVAANASEEGRRNTALALGAAAAYLLTTQKNKTAGIVAGAGAAYAYKRYDDSIKDRHNRERYGYYDRDYRYNDRNDRYGNERYDRYGRNDDRYYDARDYRYNDRYNDRYSDSRYNDRYYSKGSRYDDDCRDNRSRRR
jgi:hypothetical protein